MEDEIAHLRSLDLIGLQCRWQSVMGRPAPEHLPKHLLFGILAYRIQADALWGSRCCDDSTSEACGYRADFE